ncbi:hypothetical protein KAR48_12530 [bacterium]|nr:hypothetical protein [bacterium]
MLNKKLLITILAVLTIRAGLLAQAPPSVKLSYNRFYNYDEVTGLLKSLIKQYPAFLSLQSIGKSTQGRDMWVVTMNNTKTGEEAHKAAMYIDANIHGNEVQGAEAVIYTIDYLMTNYNRIPSVTELVDQRVFYFVPMANPDGRAHFFDKTGMCGYARSGMQPTDNDKDGLADEDGNDDLDGDGLILQMRKKVTYGTHKISAHDSRLMIRTSPGESGNYIMLGSEGIDNDHDGRLNEDGPGGYDMNRNWATDWQPNYLQRGAGNYPFSHPETRAIAKFILAHPNIAGVQAYHNAGGMILRGPGDNSQDAYPREDIMVYDHIAKRGEAMLPFYSYMILWRDLYPVHGGFIDWTAEGLGIFSFSNELWSTSQYHNKARDGGRRDRSSDAYQIKQKKRLRFDDDVEMGAQYVEWKPFDHPDYGEIELGGWVHETGRVPPLFMLEELCHRNAVFTLYHAAQMPLIKLETIKIEKLDHDLYKIWTAIINERAIPTIGQLAGKNHLISPDIVELKGGRIEVISAGLVKDEWNNQVTPIEHRPERIVLDKGIKGNGRQIIQWIVKGSGTPTIYWQSQMGGVITTKVQLKQ